MTHRWAGIALLSLLLAPAALIAGQKAYHVCKISNGQVFSCDGSWFQGETPVERDGSYHMCKISNGQVFSCDGRWFQGETPVLHEGAWHVCKISNGKVFSCDGAWYQGTAVVYTDR